MRSRKYTWKTKVLLLFSLHGFLARELVILFLIYHAKWVLDSSLLYSTPVRLHYLVYRQIAENWNVEAYFRLETIHSGVPLCSLLLPYASLCRDSPALALQHPFGLCCSREFQQETWTAGIWEKAWGKGGVNWSLRTPIGLTGLQIQHDQCCTLVWKTTSTTCTVNWKWL